jgi:hypothetical protein
MLEEPTPRSAFLSFRVTPDEREFVQTVASDAGLSVGQLIRRALARETCVNERDEDAVVA